jgi:hypothetical protein
MQRLLDGDWNSPEFLVLQPGSRIVADVTSDGIIAEER